MTFSLTENKLAKLDIYNIIGESIASLINREMVRGNHVVSFNASNLPSGIYFYKLEQGNQSALKKMILLK